MVCGLKLKPWAGGGGCVDVATGGCVDVVPEMAPVVDVSSVVAAAVVSAGAVVGPSPLPEHAVATSTAARKQPTVCLRMPPSACCMLHAGGCIPFHQ